MDELQWPERGTLAVTQDCVGRASTAKVLPISTPPAKYDPVSNVLIMAQR